MAPPSVPSLPLIRTTLAGLALPGQALRAVAAPLDFEEVDAAQRSCGAVNVPTNGSLSRCRISRVDPSKVNGRHSRSIRIRFESLLRSSVCESPIAALQGDFDRGSYRAFNSAGLHGQYADEHQPGS